MRVEKPKLATGSALQRFTPGSIFSSMGLSKQFAGDKLYSQVLEVCQKFQDENAGKY